MYLLHLEENLFDIPKRDIYSIIKEFEPLIFKFFPNWKNINFDSFHSKKSYSGVLTKDNLSRIFTSQDLKNSLEKDDSIIIVLDFKTKNSYRKKTIWASIHSYINISFNKSLFEILEDTIISNNLKGIGNFSDLKPFIDSKLYKKVVEEFTELNLKVSLSHELSHWLDAINNKNHIEIAMNKFIRGDTKNLYNAKYIDAHYVEINAQIHALQTLKQQLGKQWNNINTYQAIYRIPSLNSLYRFLKEKQDGSEKEWILKIVKRLARENILGAKMAIIPKDDSILIENSFPFEKEFNYITNEYN